ncbi:hypothetical protein [Streptomyces sp. WMMC1477]|uniref:hypothetical protein n=1 Tax=Streptomyces sp. WMMC1477 TaxID=3015155 RepID=UPI0022B6B689|nr:hypothetical protein [Streptomyces sp. WMMC1477]MCZ7433637.1 hypothetical protein [Streptomyces sp. WMMC1477]
MGLNVVLRSAVMRGLAGGPRVLLVACPGGTAVRLAAEAAVGERGGRLALTPAEADVLLVAGEPAAELRSAVDVLWGQMPGPRRLGQAARARDVGAVLEALLPGRGDGGRAARSAPWAPSGGDGETARLGEPVMAGRGEDRDGLRLDVLRVPLGPVLPDWPAGLVVDTVVQGDVVQRAGGRVLPFAGPRRPPFWHAGKSPDARRRRTAAAHLDSLGRLLAVAGWEAAAREARRLRDRLLDGEPERGVRADVGAWRRRVERSRTLRWATDGLGVLTPADAAGLGVSGPAARARAPHDATARWRRWLEEADGLLAGGPVRDGGPRGSATVEGVPPSRGLLAAAVERMPGRELSAARLLLASLDPDPDELAAGRAPGGTRGVGVR